MLGEGLEGGALVGGRCATRITHIQVSQRQQFAGPRRRTLLTNRTLRKLSVRTLNCEPRLQTVAQVREFLGFAYMTAGCLGRPLPLVPRE